VTQKVLSCFFAFKIHRCVTVLIDNNAISILNGFNDILMAHHLQKQLGTGKNRHKKTAHTKVILLKKTDKPGTIIMAEPSGIAENARLSEGWVG